VQKTAGVSAGELETLRTKAKWHDTNNTKGCVIRSQEQEEQMTTQHPTALTAARAEWPNNVWQWSGVALAVTLLISAAIGDIARAKGMSQIARKTGLGRESLYKALSPGGNPEFATILKVVRALGLKFHIEASAH